ncbi:MAG: hypothetical protein AB7S26_01915 [Sandaracinaceae bacterium]
MLEPIRIHHDGPNLVLASWSDFFFQYWKGDGTIEDCRLMFREHMKFVDSLHDKKTFSLAHISMVRFRPPDSGMTDVIRQHGAAINPRTYAGVTVIEADGFAGAVARGVVSGLTLVRRGAPKLVVETTPLAGIRHLLRHAPPDYPTVDAEELTAHYLAAVRNR